MFNRRFMPMMQGPMFPQQAQNPMTQIPQAMMPPPQPQQQQKDSMGGLGGLGGLGLMSMLNQQKTPESDMSGVMNAAGVPTLDPIAQAGMMEEAQGLGIGLPQLMQQPGQGMLPPWLTRMFGG